MPVLTVIEYAQGLRHLKKLVAVAPFAETALGDVQCFYCHEYQTDITTPAHTVWCVWDNARDFLRQIGG